MANWRIQREGVLASQRYLTLPHRPDPDHQTRRNLPLQPALRLTLKQKSARYRMKEKRKSEGDAETPKISNEKNRTGTDNARLETTMHRLSTYRLYQAPEIGSSRFRRLQSFQAAHHLKKYQVMSEAPSVTSPKKMLHTPRRTGILSPNCGPPKNQTRENPDCDTV